MAYACLAVNRAEIDKRKTYYRDVIRQWSTNLHELDEHPTYRLLAAGEMSGSTGSATNSVVEESAQLWGWLGELRDQLDHVDVLIEQRSMLNSNDEDIQVLLAERSIQLLASSVPGDLPRTLQKRLEPQPGDDRTVLVSCDGLIELFRVTYERVREIVAQVDAVWRDLMPRIDAATVTVNRATAISERLSVRLPEVMLAKQRLEAVRSSVSDDPLSLSPRVGPDLDELAAAAAAAAGKLDHAHSSLDSDLEGTDVVLADLRVLRARAAAAYSEAEAKVVPSDALIPVVGTSVIDGQNGLAHRSVQIFGQASTGTRDWQTARRELDAWHAMASRLSEQLERALKANTEPLRQREELRARLRAYLVKADMTPGLPSEVRSIGQSAHDELFTSPTNVGRAEGLLEKFAAELAAYGGGR